MCGIVGVFGAPYSSKEVYQGLLLLQHRGQDAAGILALDHSSGPGGDFRLIKEKGLVDQVFDQTSLQKLPGNLSLGHTRYSTIGLVDERDLQPLLLNYPYGMGMIHNGNLVNAHELKEKLSSEKKRYLFSQNDLEVILNIFADALNNSLKENLNWKKEDTFRLLGSAVQEVFKQARGGYSVIGCVATMGLIAFRDPSGIRPLILGERELTEEEKLINKSKMSKSYCLASESNVLEYLGYKIVRDLKAGEFLFVDESGILHSTLLTQQEHKPCMFEWVYFANPEAVMEKQDVYAARLNMGKNLGHRIQDLISKNEISPDVVVPVPDTSRPSAIALAETLGISYREILIKNRYIQRSFILNTQAERSRAVNLKLIPVKNEFKGKKVLLVDDSIVRGTTSKHIVRMVREAGAQEVYLASTCPPIRHPCFYGIDFPDPKELVATDRNEKEIAQILGADRVIYLTIEDLKKSLGRTSLCSACLDGNYPVDVTQGEKFRQTRRGQDELFT